MKKLLIVGSRPQLIKASALVKRIPDLVICNTGQHYKEMNDLYQDFEIKYNLRIGSHSHAVMTAKMMIAIEKVITEEKPELVIVIGDTNSTLAGALTAHKMGIKVAHIEAGCRSFDNIPEEANRVITDHISDHLLCSTEKEAINLVNEGVKKAIFITGDLMADIVKGKWKPKGYVLCTIHRPENTDSKERLQAIITDLKKFNKVIFPVHPRTEKMLREFKIDTTGIEMIKPLSLTEMIKMECGANLIVTDSGGVQRDAHLLGIPSVIVREHNEWDHLTKPGMLGKDVAKTIKKILEEV